MLFIVLNHYSGEEPWQHLTNASNAMLVSYYIYKPLGQVGVNLFICFNYWLFFNRTFRYINQFNQKGSQSILRSMVLFCPHLYNWNNLFTFYFFKRNSY